MNEAKPNEAKPDVKIMLDRERVLRFDLNAMCEFETTTGQDLFDGGFPGTKMTFVIMRFMLWACLLDEDPTITLKQVGRLIGIWNMNYVTSRLSLAYEVAIPKQPEGKSARPLPGEEVPVEEGSTG